MILILSLVLFVSIVFGNPDWNGFRVTWSLNPFNGFGFDALPRDVQSKSAEFVPRDDQCRNATSKFLGQRYWTKHDPAVVLLFDKKNTIAGIQTSIPKANFTPSTFLANRHFIEDGDYWTLTAYFVEPNTICANGRSQDEMKKTGTGTGLWFQQGPDPIKDSVRIPMNESEVKAKSSWTFGHCFWTMGNHYWYNVSSDMDCDRFVPNCLLYNGGKLTGFCFTVPVALASPRYEHPSEEEAKKFIDPVPTCFNSSFKKISSMHVYFVDNPRISAWC